MKNLTQFFTTGQGLTSTSANFLCNIAKEYLETIHSQLTSFNTWDEYMSLIDSDSVHQTKVGNKDISIFNGHLAQIATINAFVAWLREAIRTKEELMDYNNVERELEKQFTEPKDPTVSQLVSKSDVMAEWDEKKLAKYYALEAVSAHFGKYIHPRMPLSMIRSKYLEVLSNPIVITGSGHDAMKIERKPTISPDDMENLFMGLQNKYRDAEKQLNAMKYELEEEVSKRNIEISNQNTKALSDYRIAKQLYHEELHKAVQEQIDEIAKWKIKVPEQFKETCKILNQISKGRTE